MWRPEQHYIRIVEVDPHATYFESSLAADLWYLLSDGKLNPLKNRREGANINNHRLRDSTTQHKSNSEKGFHHFIQPSASRNVKLICHSNSQKQAPSCSLLLRRRAR